MSAPILAYPLAADAGQVRRPFDTIIMDERIGGHSVTSRIARASGTQCISIRGDLTRLWFDSLRGACLERSTVVAGFTSDLDSEVIRAFARDVGYRQVLRLDIEIDGETGRKSIRRSIDPALPREFALSSELEDLVDYELENLVDYYVTLSMPASDRRSPTQLAAWVIAPIRG